MRYKQIATSPKTFALIMETGDEITGVLKRVAGMEKFGASSFKAIGALSHVQLGWFNWEMKHYEIAVEFSEQVELLSLIGDIALKGNEPQVHAHMTVGRRDGRVLRRTSPEGRRAAHVRIDPHRKPRTLTEAIRRRLWTGSDQTLTVPQASPEPTLLRLIRMGLDALTRAQASKPKMPKLARRELLKLCGTG
jgi:hypothetical protein